MTGHGTEYVVNVLNCFLRVHISRNLFATVLKLRDDIILKTWIIYLFLKRLGLNSSVDCLAVSCPCAYVSILFQQLLKPFRFQGIERFTCACHLGRKITNCWRHAASLRCLSIPLLSCGFCVSGFTGPLWAAIIAQTARVNRLALC